MKKEISKCDKLEKSLKILFGGYYKKEVQLQERFNQIMKDYQRRAIELEVFKVFEGQDKRSLNSRLDEMRRTL